MPTEIVGGAQAASSQESIVPASERYHLTRIIGEGGMAVVYEGHDKLLDRTVAVKILKGEIDSDPEMRKRFFLEAKLLGQMEHPGMVPVIETGEIPGVGPFYSMKRVRGKTFRELLNARGDPAFAGDHETADLLRIYEKVCLTVSYAHTRGIVHRDLKPDNIMVDDFGVVLVLDWGLSKRINVTEADQGITATQAGVVKGTPAYMSPEQASGQNEATDFRTDVFALGIILYEILTGDLPFSGKTHSEVLEEIVRRDPKSPRKVYRKADHVLTAICMKALQKDPDHRYLSAKELADDVRRWRDRMPTTAYRRRPAEHIAYWIERHQAMATAIVTAFIIMNVILFPAFHQIRTIQIRNQEQARAAVIADEHEELQRQVLLKEEIDAMKVLADRITALDDQILEAEQQKDKADFGNTDQAARFNAKLAELRSVRSWYDEEAQWTGQRILSLAAKEHGVMPGEMQGEIVDTMRELMIEDLKSLTKIGEYYRAHNGVWRYIVRAGQLGWNQEEMAELLQLKDDLEAKIREGHGPGFPIPDWSQYIPDTQLYKPMKEGEDAAEASGGTNPASQE